MKIRDRITAFRRVKASDLVPNAGNWRKHPERQRSALAAAIEEIGFADVAIAREVNGHLELLDGHLRRDLAGDEEIPVIVVDLDDEEARKLLLTLDPLAGMAEADTEKLEALLRQVETESGDLQRLMDAVAKEHGIKLEPDELIDPEPQLDRAEELQEKWGTESGQLWLVDGKQQHRLLCGDSTKREDVESLFYGDVAAMVVTDPPYSSGGFQDGLKRHSSSVGTRGNSEVARDNLSSRGYISLIGRILDNISSDVCYIFTDWRMWSWTFDVLESSGWPVRNMLVWDKGQMGMGFPWRNQHELIAFAKRTGSKMGDGKKGNVLSAKRTGNRLHATEKPMELINQIISNTPGDSVYDPFAGSGTTIVSAEHTKRRSFAIEIEPKYVAVALERMATLGCNCKLA